MAMCGTKRSFRAEVEVTDAYETDALLMKSGLLCLEDDMEFFPPYQCVNVSGAMSMSGIRNCGRFCRCWTMPSPPRRCREMNYKVDVEGMTTQEVAHEFLVEKGLV